MYTLKVEVVSGLVDIASTKSVLKTELWHMRLGHVGERGMVELGRRNLLGDDKIKKLELCDPCVFGKAYRVKFNKGKQKTHGSLDFTNSS